MSRILLFDIGNTRLKWAAIESLNQNPADRNKNLWAYSGAISTKLLLEPKYCNELAEYISRTLPKPDAIGICCVAEDIASANLKGLFPQWHNINWRRIRGNSPFQEMKSLYINPEKLGADRWAAAIGARALSNGNNLIVNAGTASTIDLLGSNGVHYGGWILPGFGLMQESLHANTAHLPARVIPESPQKMSSGFGTSTNESIHAGCIAAQIGAIQRALQLAKTINHPVDRIWLDGGNSRKLFNEIKTLTDINTSQVELTENLVLRGLWAWLLTNP